MARPFVSEFLLPLVAGGTLEVGRPLSLGDVDALIRAEREGPTTDAEREAAAALRAARRRALLPLVAAPPTPGLDRDTWRLGAAVHNLLALAHPRIGAGAGADSRIQRVAAAAAALARLGAPTTFGRALTRHSLVARLGDVVRDDHTVRFWLGRKTFVGRRPPARFVALPRVRAVKVESVRRTWLREVGVLAAARPAFAALTEASPLGEALDPLRLDPPWSWGRVLAVLKFPELCRLVAGRLLGLGLGRIGDALTESLYRFVYLQDASGPVFPTAEAIAFALGFLAHLAWLDHLFAPGADSTALAGRDLAVLLAAASRVEPQLIWPPDVALVSDVGQSFAERLQVIFRRHDVEKSPRWPAALELVQRAAVSARRLRAGHAV